jgi:hypothetical protein
MRRPAGTRGRYNGDVLSEHAASGPIDTTSAPSTIAAVLRDLEPMGDLRRFVIEDLTTTEDDKFFQVLEDA